MLQEGNGYVRLSMYINWHVCMCKCSGTIQSSSFGLLGADLKRIIELLVMLFIPTKLYRCLHVTHPSIPPLCLSIICKKTNKHESICKKQYLAYQDIGLVPRLSPRVYASDRKLGGAWEQGYQDMIHLKI